MTRSASPVSRISTAFWWKSVSQRSIIRFAQADDLDRPFVRAVVLGRQLVTDLDGAVLGAVLGEDDLVAPPERLEALSQVDDGGMEDRLLVVDGDDNRDVRVRRMRGGAGSRRGCHDKRRLP
jgi:hypothetical protein